MNKQLFVIGLWVALAISALGLTSYITYKVDDHFDYVKELEEKVETLQKENIGLLSAISEKPSK